MVNFVYYYFEVWDEMLEIFSELQGIIFLEIQWFGLEDGSVMLSVIVGSLNVVVVLALQVFVFDLLESMGYFFDYMVMLGLVIIEEVCFVIVLDYGGYVYCDILEKIYFNGVINIVFVDFMDSLFNWIISGFWVLIIEVFVFVFNFFIDSFFSNYFVGIINLLMLNENLALNEEVGKVFLCF